MRCAVFNCKSNNNYGRRKFRFFSFPKDEILSKKWLKFCRRNGRFNTKTSCICELHFEAKDFERNMQYEMGFSSINPTKLIRGAIPTVYFKTPITQPEFEKQKTLDKRATKQIINSLLNDDAECTSVPFEVIELNDNSTCASQETQHLKHLEDEVTKLKKETNHLKEVQRLQEAEINEIKTFLKKFETHRSNIFNTTE